MANLQGGTEKDPKNTGNVDGMLQCEETVPAGVKHASVSPDVEGLRKEYGKIKLMKSM